MCGICGFVQNDSNLGEGVLRAMNATIVHRGPDEEGLFYDGTAALGIRRLNVIDLVTGSQPVANETGDVRVVFNGEIYNFAALRRELEGLGHVFTTRSDTETIVHLYEEHGDGCVERLRGMFAFALWDARKRRLLAARDRLGKKPLFYTLRGGALLFGSEIKAILAAPGGAPPVDFLALDDYLTHQYIHAPRTIYKGIHKLPAAHRLVFEAGRAEPVIEPYWNPLRLAESGGAPKTEADCADAVRAALTEAVRMRLVSDVPLGALLSGGIDSTIVTALMAAATSRPVRTFTIGFEEAPYNETEYARAAARAFSTEHSEMIVRPDGAALLPKLIRHFDEPFADPSAIPTFAVCEMARRDVTVALTGDGGDELFAGYTRYLPERFDAAGNALPAAVRSGLLRPAFRAAYPKLKKTRLARRMGLEPVDKLLRAPVFIDEAKALLYTPALREATAGSRPARNVMRHVEDSRSPELLNRVLYADMKTYLVDDVLAKVDRMSMAVSLEARSPLLDHEFVELALSLPVGMKLSGGVSKRILREAFRKEIPAEVSSRGKGGFGLPIDFWLRGALGGFAKETLLSPEARRRGLFDTARVETMLSEHAAGARNFDRELWSLLALETWFSIYEGNLAI